MHSREATNTKSIVFGLIRPMLEPTMYRTRDEHDAVFCVKEVVVKLRVYNSIMISDVYCRILY